MPARAPLLVIGIGNLSRGDDALGPLFVEAAGRALAPEVAAGRLEMLVEYQLQVENVLDLEGRARVVFVDAALEGERPFRCGRVEAGADRTPFTHALSPEALLASHRDVAGEPPEAWLLAIKGERFGLGEPLSDAAKAHLDAAVAFFAGAVRDGQYCMPSASGLPS